MHMHWSRGMVRMHNCYRHNQNYKTKVRKYRTRRQYDITLVHFLQHSEHGWNILNCYTNHSIAPTIHYKIISCLTMLNVMLCVSGIAKTRMSPMYTITGLDLPCIVLGIDAMSIDSNKSYIMHM